MIQSESAAGPHDAAMAEAIELHKLARLADAEARYQAVLEAAPDHAGALHYLGLLRQDQGRTEEALGLVRRAVVLDPASQLFAFNLALLLLAKGERGAAERALRRAVGLDSSSPEPLTTLAAMLAATGRADEAVDLYGLLAKLTPEDPSLPPQQAAALIRAGRIGQAREILQQALAYGDTAPETALLLAETLLLAGDPPGALAVIQPLAARSGESETQYLVAELQARLGQGAEAVAAARTLTAAASDRTSALIRFARCWSWPAIRPPLPTPVPKPPRWMTRTSLRTPVLDGWLWPWATSITRFQRCRKPCVCRPRTKRTDKCWAKRWWRRVGSTKPRPSIRIGCKTPRATPLPVIGRPLASARLGPSGRRPTM